MKTHDRYTGVHSTVLEIFGVNWRFYPHSRRREFQQHYQDTIFVRFTCNMCRSVIVNNYYYSLIPPPTLGPPFTFLKQPLSFEGFNSCLSTLSFPISPSNPRPVHLQSFKISLNNLLQTYQVIPTHIQYFLVFKANKINPE